MPRSLSRLLLVLVGALLISMFGTGLVTPVKRAQAAIVSCTSLQWGTYLTNAPLDPSMASLRTMDTNINRHSSIVHWYTQWGASWGTWAYNHPLFDNMHNYNSVNGVGATPLLTWEAWGPSPFTVANNTFPLKNIAAGNYDAYIDSWAVGLHSLGYPVMLDVFHEMDGNWYPWGYGVNGNTQADYIAAYRHVHDRFALAGATNVQFVWNPDAWNPAGVDQRTFYPGDAFVDWMAIDVYNWGAAAGTWESLTQLLADQQIYNKLAGLSTKPMMFAEWGTAEPVAGDPAGVTKGQWIIDAAQAIGSQFTRIKAVVWFSENGTPFALDSSANSMTGATTAFGGCPTSGPTPTPTPTPTPAPTPTPPPSSPNVILNPGFESGSANWTLAPRASINTAATNLRSGARSLKLVASTGWQACWQEVAVTTGRTYALSGYEHGSSGAVLTVASYDASWNQIGASADLYFPGGSTWNFVSGKFTVPAGAVHTTVSATSYRSGTFWFDDLGFKAE